MRRRNFIKGIAISAAGWPLLAGAQQLQSAKRIGILMGYAEDDPEAQRRIAAFQDGLAQVGWTVERNLQIDLRWGGGDIERIKQLAGEIVALKPDVIIGNTTPVSVALKGTTASIPIVFVIVSDPVGAWHGRAAMLLGSSTSKRLWEASGSNSSKRWRRT